MLINQEWYFDMSFYVYIDSWSGIWIALAWCGGELNLQNVVIYAWN